MHHPHQRLQINQRKSVDQHKLTINVDKEYSLPFISIFLANHLHKIFIQLQDLLKFIYSLLHYDYHVLRKRTFCKCIIVLQIISKRHKINNDRTSLCINNFHIKGIYNKKKFLKILHIISIGSKGFQMWSTSYYNK